VPAIDTADVNHESHHTVRTTVMVITLVATAVSFLGVVGMLAQYFAHTAVWPSLMAIGLWGFPVAFVGLAWLICISVRDRRIAEREAAKILGA
jgi:quinol-cytochrome oxidoreductase complex cytochrome b subunit